MQTTPSTSASRSARSLQRTPAEPALVGGATTLRHVQGDCARCLAAGGVFIVVASSEELSQQLAGDPVHEDDDQRAQRYTRPSDRLNFLAGRRLLARLMPGGPVEPPIVGAAGAPTRAPIQVRPTGQPMPRNGVHISVSHSEHLLSVALTRSGPVGVDVESRSGFERNATVVDRIAHDEERAFVGTASQPDAALSRRLKIWTRKEALSKAMGVGIGFDANAWNTLPGRVVVEGADPQGYALRTHAGPRWNWVLSVASQPERPIRMVLLRG
jgi:phosphopantetheinyl transferase